MSETEPEVIVESHLTNYKEDTHKISVRAVDSENEIEITVYFDDDPSVQEVVFDRVVVNADIVPDANAADLIARAMGAAAIDLVNNSGVSQSDINMGRFKKLATAYV